ncbi:glyoxalase-like domain protein [Anaerotignum neopropionicum]|uniref:Glyoxalase-like domain protein n=1 Tax=Anaerotignum neopropionicum TaxID=36847 RepID=A0A136WBK2_9FIRM|nr:VOC family protein [Anaerotignum neopropionicum]KXL51709.1 glyoxalase-like domain protein [Anaerotignum neopropionicum]
MNNYDNFFLPVDDLPSAKNFYENVLGLAVKFDYSLNGMIAFNVGTQEPAIILKDKKKFQDMKPTIWFVVNDVETEYKNMMAKGIHFLTKPFSIRTGMAVEFEDPFGNRLGITDYK